MEYEFRLNTDVYFGQGISRKLPDKLKETGFSKPAIVVDEGVYKTVAAVNLISGLKNSGFCPIYTFKSRGGEEPDYDYLDNCAAEFKKYDVDCLIGIGGGSAMDLCKGVAVLIKNPGRGIEYRGLNKVNNPSLPAILIPTTAGTGSEATPSAVFIDKAANIKKGINGRYVSAYMAFLDSDFTSSCPPKVAISSGLDAMVHALEAFMTTKQNPIIWQMAIQAWRLLSDSFEAAVNDRQAHKARLNMLLGSYLAGITLRYSGGGIAGALAYPIGTEYKVPHGIAGGVFLKHIIEMNIAGGYKGYNILHRKSKRFLEEFNQLLLSINAPLGLHDFNIPKSDIDRIVKLTTQQRNEVLQNNPIPVNKKALSKLLEKTIIGTSKSRKGNSEFIGVLQARMASTRLPGKMMMEICGEPIIQLILKRLKKTKTVSKWILATTDQAADDKLIEIAVNLDIPYFRGSEEDVLDRLYQCAKEYNIKYIVTASGDNPLLDTRVLDKTVERFIALKKDFDYFSNHHPLTFPDGQEVQIIPFKSLEIAWKEAKQPHEREHGTPFLWDQPERFKIGNFKYPGENLYPANRWTLDYYEDYEMIKAVFDELYPSNPDFGMEDILRLKKNRPDIFAINHMHYGKIWYNQEKDKLKTI